MTQCKCLRTFKGNQRQDLQMWHGFGHWLQTSSGGPGTVVKPHYLLTRLGWRLQELLSVPWRYWGPSHPGT